MAAVIETRGLTKHYGAVRAVEQVDLRVEGGQVFGFLGPNGAGKTTTIRMLLGLHRPSAGRALVLGFDPIRESVALHQRVGYLPGELALYPRMTGSRHIAFFARARGLGDLSGAHDLAARLNAILDRPTHELSRGNRQKLGLVLALMGRPELLVLDEPTAGLDPLVRDEFDRLMRERVARGTSVFLSSHDLEEVQRLADHVAIIRQGRIVRCESIDVLRASAPQRIRARFPRPLDPALFATIPGVAVCACDGPGVELEAAGPIGPLLRLIAEHDPVDFTCRHADLDELFRGFYRDRPDGQAPDAH